jgi:hypothetical protein
VIHKGQVAAIQIASSISGEVDEDEKTTIESGWEEEPSTTVEQGELAAKLRAVGTGEPQRTITSVTSTNATNLEEPTMDDQRANQALASLPVMTPSELLSPDALGRLICTQGNDSGREYEIRPGKSYSIGRAIDNDVVLTDISVSRKHFDLRLDGGVWMLVDRGSGNGTLVNGNLEDAPFLLSGGDRIEIGNTSFRFDLPNLPPLPAQVARASDFDIELDEAPSQIRDSRDSRDDSGDSEGSTRRRLDDDEDDDEEPSTVAGKPLREVAPEPAPERAYVPPIRPKTLPPPMPMRQQQRSGSPPPYALGSQPMGAMGSVNAGPTAPAAPNAMTVSPLQGMPPLQLSAPPAMPMSVPGALPQSTLPLPQMANRPPPHMLDGGYLPTTLPGQGHQQQPRPLDLRSASPSIPPAMSGQALPPPPSMPGMQMPPMMQSQQHPSMGYPQLHAQMQPHDLPSQMQPPGQMPMQMQMPSQIQPQMMGYGMRGDSGPMASAPYGAPMQASYVATPDRTGARRLKLVLGGVALTMLAAAATIVIIRHSGSSSAPDVADSDQKTDGSAAPTKDTKSDKHFTPPMPPAPQAPAVPQQPTHPPTVTPIQPHPTVTPLAPANPVAPPGEPHVQPHIAPPGEPHAQPHTAPPVAQPPSTANIDDLKRSAAAAYRQKNFSGAVQLLRDGYKGMSTSERKNLPSLAKYYELVGLGFNVSSATNAADSFNILTMAIAADRNLESAYVSELTPKLQAASAKAALAYVIRSQLENALSAVHVAESAGVGLETVALVRKKLDQKAAELYAKANTERDSNPKDAKQLAHRIMGFVDQQSPWYAKAQSLLGG